jgi:hypothetical protein
MNGAVSQKAASLFAVVGSAGAMLATSLMNDSHLQKRG